MPELLDIRDEQGNLTGETMARPEVHRNEAWHAIALVWIYNSKGEILIQRRAAHLNAFPEKWDVTVSGHLSASDTPLQAAVRELSEELGIYAAPEDMEPYGMMADSFPLKYGKIHRECDYIFLLRHDVDISTLKLQAAEVMEVRWITPDGLERDLSNLITKQSYSRRNPKLYQIVAEAARKQMVSVAGV
jgi:isopentenyl-diphosphate delta-isomerase